MKKNKKLMLAAIAAMGVAAMGVGGMSTFAWYSAGAAAGAKGASAVLNGTMSTTNASAATTTKLYAKFQAAPENHAVALTTSDGKAFAVVGGKLQNATAAYYWNTMTVSFVGYYKDEACTQLPDTGDVENLKSGITFTISAQAGSRTRLLGSANAPATAVNEETNAFASALKASVSSFCTFTVASAGANPTLSSAAGTNILYYSIAGEVTNAGQNDEADVASSALTVGSDYSEKTEVNGSVQGSITLTVAVNNG